MRRTLIFLCFATAILRVASASAQTYPCEFSTQYEEESIKTYLAKTRPGPDNAASVLTFNHRKQLWNAWEWDGEKLVQTKNRVDFDVQFTGKAMLSVPRKTPLVVLVTDTNPLLFSAAAVETAEVNRPDLAAIQAVALGLGNFATGVVSTIPAAFRMDTNARGLRSLSPTARDAFAQLIEEISDLAKSLVVTINNEADAPTNAKEAAALAAKVLAKTLQKIENENSALRAYLQRIESCDEPADVDLLSHEIGLQKLPGTLAQQHQAFYVKAAVVKSTPYACIDPLNTLAEIVNIQLRGMPSDPFDQRQIKARYEKLAKKLLVLTPDCKPLQTDLAEIAAKLRQLFKDYPDLLPQLKDEGATKSLEELVATVTDLVGAENDRVALLEGVAEIRKKEGDATKMAAFVADVARTEAEVLKVAADPKGRALVHGVVEAPRGEVGGVEIAWSKIRPGKLTVELKAPFKDLLVLSHPAKVEREYEIRGRRNFEFGADAGVIYSEVTQPTWKAVDDPSTMNTEKFITRTDEKKSAGDIALFLNFVPLRFDGLRRAHMGFQVGAGGGTSDPSLLAGLTFQTGALRWGVGWNWQKVQDLARGQREFGKENPTVVADNDAIRYRSGFDNSWYASLTIAIDDLPFFNR